MITRHQGIKALLSLVLLFYAGAAIAQEDKQPIQSEFIAEQTVNEDINNVENKINSIHDLVASQEEKTEQKIKGLETLISSQQDTIKTLELELKMLASKPITNGITFEVWIGILLACVAIMVTVLSISIAAMHFIGSRNVRRESLEVSSATASEIATKVAPAVAEDVVKKYFDEGKFDKIILQAVDQIAFSNIADPDLDYKEEASNGDI
jgi:hypothetical protein